MAHIPVRKILEEINVGAEGVRWCGGWDLNPRRPTPSGPKPDPFDQARAPPLQLSFPLIMGLIKCYALYYLVGVVYWMG